MIDLTKDTFADAVKTGVVLVDFWAEWCAPCKMFGPVFAKVAKTYEGKAKFFKVETESQYQMVASLKINSLPTTLIYKDGKVVDRVEGLIREAQLAEKIESVLK